MSKRLINHISRSIRSNQSSCIYSLPGPNIDVQVLPLLHDVGRATACRHRASPPPCLPLAALLVSSSRFLSPIAPMDPTWSNVSTAVFFFSGGSRYVNLFTSFAHCLLLSGPSPLRLRSVFLNLRSVNPNLSILVLFQLTEPPVNLTASSTSNHNFRRLDLLCSRGSTYNSIFRFRFLLVHASVLSAVSTYYTLGLQPALFLSTPSSRSEVQSDVSPLTEPIPTACQSPLWLHHSSLPNEVNPLLLLGWWAIT